MEIQEVTCTDEHPCVHCYTGTPNCLKTDQGHTIDCLYEFELNSLGLQDSPDMRVLFWSSNGALQWKNDQPVPPELHPDNCPCIERGKKNG